MADFAIVQNSLVPLGTPQTTCWIIVFRHLHCRMKH